MSQIESDLTEKDKTGSPAIGSLHVMATHEFEYTTDRLKQAHALARAVHLWVRHRSISESSNGAPFSEPSRRAFAGGLIIGLSQRFEFDARDTELMAYVYSLMDGAARDALHVATALLEVDQDPLLQSGYWSGLMEAEKLIQHLDHEDKQH